MFSRSLGLVQIEKRHNHLVFCMKISCKKEFSQGRQKALAPALLV